MSMNDPIADFLTRIRNAGAAKHSTCAVSASNMKERLARILSDEGYIDGFSVEGEGFRRSLVMKLKYAADGRPVIRGIDRVSKPGRRQYRGADEVPRVLNGLGLSIVSTSRGLVTDKEARRLKVGGEVICNVW
jgi:small subunit ribosomal protein S8